jgi:hypothetical protein
MRSDLEKCPVCEKGYGGIFHIPWQLEDGRIRGMGCRYPDEVVK